MSADHDTIERHELILDELARFGLELARDLSKRAMEAEDPDQAARLALAFAQVSRSVRQSLALESRLNRDAARARREAREDAKVEDKALRERRVAQLRSGVRRALAESPERETMPFLSRLELAILDGYGDDHFLDGPVEAHVARLCRTLGVEPPAASETPSPPPSPANCHDADPPVPILSSA